MIQTLADAAYESLLLLLEAVLPSTWSRALLPRQDHFPPHDRINFEGYYTRIHCDNDDSLIIITSSVPTARPEGLPYFVHCSYAPSVVATGGHHSHQTAAFRADAFPESMTVSKQPPFADNGVVPFKLDFGETGFYQVGDRQQSYHLSFSDGTEVDVDIAQRTPLFDEDPLKAPHGMFARLVHILPLQCVFALATREDGNAMRVAQVDTSLYIHTSWEIFSPKGRATYKISKSGKVLVQGEGTARTFSRNSCQHLTFSVRPHCERVLCIGRHRKELGRVIPSGLDVVRSRSGFEALHTKGPTDGCDQIHASNLLPGLRAMHQTRVSVTLWPADASWATKP